MFIGLAFIDLEFKRNCLSSSIPGSGNVCHFIPTDTYICLHISAYKIDIDNTIRDTVESMAAQLGYLLRISVTSKVSALKPIDTPK